MDLLIISALAITFGLILLVLGLSLINQSLEPMGYNSNYGERSSVDYYKNPLWRHESKYFHYRPVGTIILSRSKWAQIEKNIGERLTERFNIGKETGRKKMIAEIQDKIDAKRDKITFSNPYMVLGFPADTPRREMDSRYKVLLHNYDPSGFKHLDESFMELAEIRIAQIERAWKKIKYDVGKRKVSNE